MVTETTCDFIAGCFGGAAGILVGFPFDSIKTIQQKLNLTVGESVREIITRHQGLHGLYRGMFFPLLTHGAINSVVFAVYGSQLRELERGLGPRRLMEERDRHVFTAGMVAGLVQSFFICPIELVKVKLQTAMFRGGPWKCSKKIWQTEGFRGFYRGLTPTLARDVLPYGLYMLTYDGMLNMMEKSGIVENRRKNNVVILWAGAIAGLLSWLFVVPFDVIKTRMQVVSNPNLRISFWQCTKRVYDSGGSKAFFRGTTMILGRSIPVNAITFLGYEYCLNVCHRVFYGSGSVNEFSKDFLPND